MLGASLGLLGLGILLAVRTGSGRPNARAHELLGERFARGEISPEDYRERRAVLGAPPRRALSRLATVLTAVGLLGAIVLGATSGSGFMHRMMPGGMGSMMGRGDTARAGAAPVAGAREIRVAGSEFSFRPAEVTVKAADTVNLVFDNRGMMFHTLTIGELGLDLRANGGDSIAGALRAGRAGNYTFICAVSGHAEAGMRGSIVVSSPQAG